MCSLKGSIDFERPDTTGRFCCFSLIVSLLADPAVGAAGTEDGLSGFIIAEDEQGEWQSWEPPVEVQWVHSETLVHAWGVAQEGCESSLKDKAKVQEVVLHALLEYRVHTGLANDEISPLDNDNGHEEGSVASVLKDFPIPVGPFLTKGIFQVIDSLRIPSLSDSKQFARKEAILCHDDKVDKETC